MSSAPRPVTDPEKRPLVSVITPSYNQAQFIEDTILSVQSQQYENIEHIIVDGGSTDGTPSVVASYEGAYNLRWISEPDSGQAEAVNKGFAMARGEIIGWLNSDDAYLDECTVGKVVELFSASGADIVYGHAVKINAKGLVMRVRLVPRFNERLLRRWDFVIQPAVFLRRHVMLRERLRTDLHYSMDYEYWLRLAAAFSWRHSGEILAIDRNHPDRKIIAQRASSLAESVALRKALDVRSGSIESIGDKCLKGWLRLHGLQAMTRLYLHRSRYPRLAFDGLWGGWKRQLLGKDHKLI